MSSPWRRSIPASERASRHVLPFVLAIVWLAASSVGFYVVLVYTKGPRGLVFAYLGVFIFIGLVWAGWQAYKILSLMQAGARLELQDAPPAIGGRLKALVRLPGGAAMAGHAKVEFLCMRDGDGDRDAPNRLSTGKLWSVKREVPVRLEGAAAVVEFASEIPAGLPPTGKWDSGRDDDSGDDHVIGWQVRVSAVVGAEPVEHRFDLEVPRRRAPEAPQAAVDWLRDFAALALILANLVPVYMVLKGRADVASIAYLYWAENLVIAGYMFLRVSFAARGGFADKVGGVLFFAAWFGGVSIFVGRVLIAILLNPPRDFDELTREQFERGDSFFVHFGRQVLVTIGTHIVEAGLVAAVLALVASHGVGFVQNYIRNGRYLQARVNEEVRHLMNRSVITFGAFFVLGPLSALGSPKYVLAGVVLAKTGFEIWRYAHEQRAAAPGPAGVS